MESGQPAGFSWLTALSATVWSPASTWARNVLRISNHAVADTRSTAAATATAAIVVSRARNDSDRHRWVKA
jgi:hypothetical protein